MVYVFGKITYLDWAGLSPAPFPLLWLRACVAMQFLDNNCLENTPTVYFKQGLEETEEH